MLYWYVTVELLERDTPLTETKGDNQRSIYMVISYKKLWKLLIDKDMKKQDLREAAKLSSSTVAKLTHGENVSTAVLIKICAALQCDIADIMEVVPDGSPASEE